MPKLSTSYPKYRLHRASGQAVVTIDGRDFYLGPHGTRTSKDVYDRKIAEWLAGGRHLPSSSPSAPILRITALIALYWRHCKGHYRHADGTPTSELGLVRLALKPLKQLYGTTPAVDFGPLGLKAVRQQMIDQGLSRTGINANVGRVRRMFRWAVSNELVPPTVLQGLQAVSGLQRGRSNARETEPVKPVPDAYVEAVRPYVSRQVWVMIELQRLTGMRSGEVVIMRASDIDMSGSIWTYVPSQHKTQHHGHTRKIFLGPRAQEIIRQFFTLDTSAYLFSPQVAMDERRAERSRKRITPASCGNRPGSNKKSKPQKQPLDHYTNSSYRRAIANAIKLAKVPHWHPHQLRHNAATALRKRFGIDAARAILGHRSPAVTEVYAALDENQAATIMGQVG